MFIALATFFISLNLTSAFSLTSLLAPIENSRCDIAHDAPLFELFDKKLNGTGYSYEKHQVTTKDKYILTLVRLVKTNETSEERGKRTPVLFQHGFTMTSENWLTVEKPVSIVDADWTSWSDLSIETKNKTTPHAIVLQAMDAGHDVWLTNNRGTRYSLGHETLDARINPEYWDFSWDT